MAIVLPGSSAEPGEPCGAEDCSQCPEIPATPFEAHRLRFSKNWYGYLPFDTDGSSIITQVYRKFTVTITEPSLPYTATMSVEFNRLNGHITKSLDETAYDPETYSPFWPATGVDMLDTADSVTATSAEWTDAGGYSMEWTLSEPYTLSEFESDVDDMTALYDPGEPTVPDYDGNDVIVRYNEVEFVAPPFQSSGFAHYFPQTKAIYDSVPAPVAPAIEFETFGVLIDLIAFNSFVHNPTIVWYAFHWEKSRLMVRAYPWPSVTTSRGVISLLCLTTSVSSTFETVADVCSIPSPIGNELLIEPPPTRPLAAFVTTTTSAAILHTLCYNCFKVEGGCPCYTPTLSWFYVESVPSVIGSLQINDFFRWHDMGTLTRGNATRASVWCTSAVGNTNLKVALYDAAGALLGQGERLLIDAADVGSPPGQYIDVEFDDPIPLPDAGQDCFLAVMASDGDLFVAHKADTTGFKSSSILYTDFPPGTLGSGTAEVRINMRVYVE